MEDLTEDKQCLNPNVEEPMHRRKLFFEVAAAQSSVGNANPDLPDSLLTPTVTVLDPCTLDSTIHARIKWEIVEARLIRCRIVSKEKPRGKPAAHKVEASQNSARNSTVVTSRSDSPLQPLTLAKNGGKPQNVPMSQLTDKQKRIRRENDIFMNEVVDLIRDIKMYSDPTFSSSPSWIPKVLIAKISKQLVLVNSYLPGLVGIEEMVNALLFENGPEVMENLVIDMPEHLVSIVNILLNMTTSGIQTKYRNAVIEKIVKVYPYFVNRVVEKFSKLRTDCVFASRLAAEYLGDRQFLAFLEPLLTDRESIFSKTVLRSAGREVLSDIIARLLKMAQVVLDWQANPTGSESPEMGVAPWCTRLSFCIVDLLNSSLDEWKEKDVVTATRFVFRTTTSSNPSQPAIVEEPMDSRDDEDSNDSVVPDSEPECQYVRRPKATEPVEPTPFGDAHETFVLSALIAVPIFTQFPLNQTVAVQPPDRAVDAWLEMARKRVLSPKKVSTSFGVHLIYVHSCIMTSQIDELADFASEGMKRRVEVSQQQNHAHVLKNAFTTRCMTEIEVANRSVCQLVTNSVGNKNDDGASLALRSIHALQTASVYKTFQIDIGTWLEEQLENISVPASELLAEVVDGFAQSSAQSIGKGLKKQFVEQFQTLHSTYKSDAKKSAMFAEIADLGLRYFPDSVPDPAQKNKFGPEDVKPLERLLERIFLQLRFARELASFKEAFTGDVFDGRTIAKRLFVLLYLCSYREAAQRIDSSLRNMHYNIDLFRKMPVRYLLSIMEQQHANFESVRSKIITRTAVIYPYMLPTPESMNLIEKYQKNAEKEVVDEEEFGSEREKRLEGIRELKDLLKMLEAIDRSTLRNQLAAIPILLEIFMESLNASTPLGYESLLIAIFNRFEQLAPRTLFEKSVAFWLEEDGVITVEDVEKIPSLLFRCDRRILSSPPHFDCFVRALNFFNKMVRAENRLKMLMVQERVIQAQVHHKVGCEYDRKEKELLNGAYLDNQHSVLIHALIEVCDSKRMKDDPADFAMSERRRQIRRIAFEYIHRTFLDYEGLIRIVLYQKFPLHQVRDMVEGVPALFAGNTQILEMLSLADQQRRFFAIVFAAEICRKYRVRESLEAARTVCDIVHSLHKFGELPSSNKLWKHVAPALMLLAREFPSLADSINRLLTRVAATAKNRLAVRCGLLAGDPRHDEYQLIKTISEFLDRNNIHDRL